MLKFCCPALAALFLAAAPAPATAFAMADGWRAGDDTVVGLRTGNDLYRYCRRQARKTYGPVKGRHSGSIRIGVINQCVGAGGRLP